MMSHRALTGTRASRYGYATLRPLFAVTAATPQVRRVASMSSMNAGPSKAAGDISAVFPSLSGRAPEPMEPRFAELKKQMISGREDIYYKAWDRLLKKLEHETEEIKKLGSDIIPSIDFESILNNTISEATIANIKHRGSVVIRGVIPRDTAESYLSIAHSYINANQARIRAFPPGSPAVYELYFSPPQVAGRSHPNMLIAHKWLQTMWHSSDPHSVMSTRTPLSYADRLRIRRPGDAQFTLGPHVDSGSIERWEDPTYAKVYKEILETGNWEAHDAYDARWRLEAKMDMYNAPGGCSMLRLWQGWLAMSETGPGEGTLRVCPMLREQTAYTLLRPFFEANPDRLDASIRQKMDLTPEFPGSIPGTCQENNDLTHPHLRLKDTMIPLPKVEPGDYAAWHCDMLHSVDPMHAGKSDSAVLYIPATPLCELNAKYLVRQRACALEGSPAADFPGAGDPGQGEAGFVDQVQWERDLSKDGLRAMGMGGRENRWVGEDDMSPGERKAVEIGNRIVFP